MRCDKNKMDTDNISMVFAPNILRPEVSLHISSPPMCVLFLSVLSAYFCVLSLYLSMCFLSLGVHCVRVCCFPLLASSS